MRHINLYFVACMIASSGLLAIPSLTHKCGEKGINLALPSQSDMLTYDNECMTAYIGPPSTGSASVQGIIASANLGFCGIVKNLPKTLTSLNLMAEFWAGKLIEAFEEQQKVNEKLLVARAELIAFEGQENKVARQIERLNQELEQKRLGIVEAKKTLENCLTLSDGDDLCAAQKADVLEAKKAFINFRYDRLEPAEAELENLRADVRNLKKKIELAQGAFEEGLILMDKLKARIDGIKNEALQSYSAYGSLEGFSAQILFESKWRDQIEEARRNNKYSNLNIARLPISRSRLQIDVHTRGMNRLGIPPGLIYANIPGYTVSGTNDDVFPNGQKTIDGLSAEEPAHDSWLSAASGKIVVSLMGACDLTDQYNKIPSRTDFSALTSAITINAIHDYPMMLERNYSVKFRAFRFAEEIEKKTDKGGFFETSSVHEIISNKFSDDDFSLYFSTDDAARAWSQEEQAIIKQEAKKEIVDRVLREVGTVSQLAVSRPPMPANVPQSGAALLYKNMECYGWAYCSAAQFLIGVADSVFSKKTALAEFKSRNLNTVTANYAARSPANYAYTTTFAPSRSE